MIGPIRTIAMIAAVALGGAALAQDAEVSPEAGPTGLVRGSVVIAPACPGPARIDRPECVARPFQTSVSVYAATARGTGETPLRSVATDGRGQFELRLPVGSYRLMPRAPAGISVARPADVTVTAGSTATIQLLIDSGSR